MNRTPERADGGECPGAAGESGPDDRSGPEPAGDPVDGDRPDPERDGDPPSADEALARMRDRAATVREREVRTALNRLDARGDLSASERAAVERLAERLVDRLLAVPERRLEAVADGDGTDRGERAPVDDRPDEEARGTDAEDSARGTEEDRAREAVETALELFG
ncbi:MAG: hypothetical protein ABEJ40_00445 [Haloarculaceae archaeon]